MKANELREKFLKFFEERGHKILPSASLVPENDPSTLFISAGMQPLVPYLLGEKHPEGKRLVDVQKCIRTGDIEEVGDETHHTFFEMLGNWSLGDYFKEDSIKWSWEFLTGEEWLGLDKKRLAVSIFAGDEAVGADNESKEIWLSLGVAEERITALGKEENWWPAGGKHSGPQGPDTEIFYWTGEGEAPAGFESENKKWIEVWNNVFMEYKKDQTGELDTLEQKNVDTGMGLERVLAILNGFKDDYRTDLFWPLIKKLEEYSQKKYDDSDEEKRAMRIVADHLKAACFIISDGIWPANLGQGYVLRRLIRRAVRYVNLLGITDDKIYLDLIDEVGGIYSQVYPELIKNTGSVVMEEVKKFEKTLERGLEKLKRIKGNKNKITGKEAFDLYQTYGFPRELIREEVDFDEDKFEEELERHSDLSKTATVGMFKGGLADQTEATTRLHTASHLMLESLRRVLGSHVEQKGSNITQERLRFDFSHGEKLTESQIKEVEDMVNEEIDKDLPVCFKEMPIEEAREIKATGVFGHKYGERVKVYFMGEGGDLFSKEICGGPHVTHTGELGKFRIIKEESSGAGVRRIKAVLE